MNIESIGRRNRNPFEFHVFGDKKTVAYRTTIHAKNKKNAIRRFHEMNDYDPKNDGPLKFVVEAA